MRDTGQGRGVAEGKTKEALEVFFRVAGFGLRDKT